MPSAIPLSVLLSQVLVAFTIEFDNEFESRLAKTWARPFRVSIVMWSNFMRFVREEGTPVGEIVTASCIPKNAVVSVVGGMERWKYITVDHDPARGTAPMRKGFGTGRGVRSETLIYPSMTGKLALDLWEPLTDEIEARWKTRVGEDRVEALRDVLLEIQGQIPLTMPHFLPVVGGGGMFANAELDAGPSAPDATLPTLLSRVLLAFTLECEKESPVSLPVGSNLLRVLDTEHARKVSELPLATGTSKEAVSFAMTWLGNAGYISVEPDPTGRGKVVRITTEGAGARTEFTKRLEQVETRWEKTFGDAAGELRSVLQGLLDQPGGEDGPLSAGLVTPEGGWRGTGRYKPLTAAFVKSPRDALPHYPMVLHRGGWPDGS